MATINAPSSVRTYILEHMLESLERTPAQDEPFSHFYIENVFPEDIYARMMEEWPSPDRYKPLDAGKYHNEQGVSTRDVFSLDDEHLSGLPTRQRELWDGIAAALAAPELKSLVFRKLATDLSARFGVPAQRSREHHVVQQAVAIPRSRRLRDRPASRRPGKNRHDAALLAARPQPIGTRHGLLSPPLPFAHRRLFLAGPIREGEAIHLRPQHRLRLRRLELVEQKELARPRRTSRRLRSAQYAAEHLLRPE